MNTAEVADRMTQLYSGVIYDALHHDIGYGEPFVLDASIKCLSPGAEFLPIAGPAFTCKGGPLSVTDNIDESVRFEMYRSFTAGCIQIIDTSGDRSVAHFGDISGRLATRFGCVGVVVDGYVRDARALRRDRFPVFCKGAQPQDAYGRWQIVEYQAPIRLRGASGNVTINPGDFLFGDDDGVLVIPLALTVDVCGLAAQRLVTEERIRSNLDLYEDVQRLNDEVGRW